MDNPHFSNYPFLSDCPTPRDYGESSFYFAWFRFNELRAQFFKGMLHDKGFYAPQSAWVQAVPFNYFEQHTWYQVAFTWDDDFEEMRLYVNGILLGTNDQFHCEYDSESCGDTLYTGAPSLCHGEITMFDEVMSEEEIYADYRNGATDYDASVEKN